MSGNLVKASFYVIGVRFYLAGNAVLSEVFKTVQGVTLLLETTFNIS